MIFEILIIISAALIFIILARRLPETDESSPIADTPQNGQSKFPSFLSNFIQRVKSIKLPKIRLPKREKKIVPPLPKIGDTIEDADKLFDAGDLKGAETLYLKAAASSPRNAKIYSRLGIIYLQLKNFSDARDAFLAALKIDDRLASRHYNLGLAYMGLKAFEKAKVAVRRAIALDPNKSKYKETLKKLEE